jgi:PRD1 phage membrane DNA delivery
MSHFTEQLTVVASAIIGLATLSVILSRNSNTTNVITSAGNAFSQAVGAAVAPVMMTGGLATNVIPMENNYLQRR